MNYGERLRYARKLRKLTQKELSQKADVHEASISKIERGDQLATSFTIKLARALFVRAEWLAEGIGEMLLNDDGSDLYTLVELPILQLSDVCDYMASNILPPGTQTMKSPIKCSDKTFIVTLTDDSMLSLTGRSYPKGSMVYIDPSAPLVDDVRVLARVGGSKPIFRSYREDANKRWLMPLNHMFEKIEITDDCEILGVSIFAGMSDYP